MNVNSAVHSLPNILIKTGKLKFVLVFSGNRIFYPDHYFFLNKCPVNISIPNPKDKYVCTYANGIAMSKPAIPTIEYRAVALLSEKYLLGNSLYQLACQYKAPKSIFMIT